MDKNEARQTAHHRLCELRRLDYDQLRDLSPETVERVGPSGTVYQVETEHSAMTDGEGTYGLW